MTPACLYGRAGCAAPEGSFVRKRTGFVAFIVVVVIAVGVAAWWWLRPEAEPTAATSVNPAGVAGSSSPTSVAAGAAPTEQIPAVRFVTVSEGTAGRSIRLTGTVMPQRDVTLVAKVPGTVEWVAGDLGEPVEAGEPVVRLDATELSLALAQSEAQLAAAEANLARLEAGASAEEIAQVRAGVEQAELALSRIGDTLARQEQLYEQGIIPEETLLSLRVEYDVARLQYETAQQQLNLVLRGATEEERRAVRAQVEQAQVAVRLAEQQLADTIIRAPFSGLLAMRPVQVGSLIGAGTPVTHIVDIDRVFIEAGVSERDVNHLSVGQTVQVRIDALGDTPLTGVVDAVAPVADQQTRNFPVRFRVDNPDHLLKPGMVARVDIQLDGASIGAAVPQAAVQQRGARAVVYLLDTDSSGRFVLRERSVTVGTPAAGLVAVSGVAVGDVVALGPGPLRDGAVVHPIELDGGAFDADVFGGGM